MDTADLISGCIAGLIWGLYILYATRNSSNCTVQVARTTEDAMIDCRQADERIRDERIARAERHGWDVLQWSCDGTKAQLGRQTPANSGHWHQHYLIEVGLGVLRRFGR
jgi:hypothetical protein